MSDEKQIIYQGFSPAPCTRWKPFPSPEQPRKSSIVPPVGDNLISYSISPKHDCMPFNYTRYSIVVMAADIT